MVAISLPFVWLGVAMTLKRLRSARLPLWLMVFLFAPFINLMFFLVLCLVPERKSGVIRHTRTSRLGRIVLKFAVTSNPAPMQEWTPYSHIEPPIGMAF